MSWVRLISYGNSPHESSAFIDVGGEDDMDVTITLSLSSGSRNTGISYAITLEALEKIPIVFIKL